MGRSLVHRKHGLAAGYPGKVRIIVPTLHNIARFALGTCDRREELMTELGGWWDTNSIVVSATDERRAIELAKRDTGSLSGEEITFICSARRIFLAYHAACEAL